MLKFSAAFWTMALVAPLAATPSMAQDDIIIGGLIYARDSQFWQQVERGMIDAAAEYEVQLQMGLNRRQLPTEAQVIDDFMTRQVDAIILPPLDAQASISATRRAADRGIMIVDYDAPLADDSIASHTVGVDSFQLAAEVGAEMIEMITADFAGEGTVGLITLPPTNPNMQTRRSGVMSELDADGITITAEVTANTPEQGANAFENILQRQPDTTAIWASNSGSLSGAAAAARRTSSDVRLYGIDMSQELAEAMLDPEGNVYAVSDQQPYQIGYLAVETAVLSLRGEEQPREVEVPVRLYSRDDPAGLQEYLDLVESLAQ